MTSTSKIDTISVAIEQFGHPGSRGELVIVDVAKNDKRTDEQKLRDESVRVFEVKAALTLHHEMSAADIQAAIGEKDGDSLLSLPDDVRYGRVRTKDCDFELRKNEHGRVGQIHALCTGVAIEHVQSVFSAAVLPYLDHLSFLADVPIHVGVVDIWDGHNGVRAVSYTNPHQNKLFGPRAFAIADHLAPAYAWYREAKNNPSDFYRLLCHFKVLDGLLGRFRSEVIAEAKKKGVQLTFARLVVPSAPAVLDFYPTFVGRSVNDVVNSVLRKEFRDAVAHFSLDEPTQLLNPSDRGHRLRFSAAAILAELLVRQVIEEHERLLRQMRSDLDPAHVITTLT